MGRADFCVGLFLLLTTSAVLGAGSGKTPFISCSDDARYFTGFRASQTFAVICPRGCVNTRRPIVKGSKYYTDDSSICRAAIHAGSINNNGGRVEVRRSPGLSHYASTVHNGITSLPWRDWSHSFSFSFESQSCVRTLPLTQLSKDNFKSSSTFTTFTGAKWHPHLAQLSSRSMVNAWRPEADGREQWWQVDLGDIHDVRAIITQGSKRYTRPQYITSYKIMHKLTEDMDWVYSLDEIGRPKTFSGNKDSDGRVTNHFVPSLTARYIRLLPRSWVHHISLRAEILICLFQHQR